MSLKVGDERIRKLEGHIDSVISSMNGQVSDLESVIEMLAAHWRGDGGGQYRKAQTDINTYQRNLTKIMRQVKDAVEATRTSHGKNDQGVVDAMRGIDLNGSAAGNGMVAAGSYGDTGKGMEQYSKLDAF
ncbi:WXG100 family type VII secretion target [Streptomyces sp. NPDC050617]|uniref:WXG100 family type VII secretion target n=1 Tax=Streptomyces sp. NPDC050617 TaxID=3154628 RepID=UPI003438DFBE